MIGTKLAHYEITSHLGSGGMGDVYQATDSKLGRSVAIKLLPEVFASDAERVARFEREARVLASLNHPNIAAIYGIEQSGDRKFLVMELAGGETLAERIKQGPIPVDESLGIAKQICEALETAHEKAIVHRDLKPANVKITADGKVKVLDFGLAKAYESEASKANLSQSPTLSMAATNAGVILGTAAYMSPEQAKGRPVDKRTDIFAFGAVLYEMLTGRAPFDGDDVADILSRVLQRDPDWKLLPANVPPRIRELLQLCLEKDVTKRRRDAGDVRIDIEQALAEPVAATLTLPARGGSMGWLAFSGAALVAAMLVIPAVRYLRETPPSEMRVEITTPATQDPVQIAISPDGRKIVYVATSQNRPQLWIRSLDSGTAQPLAGTDYATYPFWSQDSRSIGFFAPGKLQRIDLAGGTPIKVANVLNGRGGAWNREGVIIFNPAGGAGPIYRVPAGGGEPVAITKLEQGQGGHRFPSFLPDGRHFLFHVLGTAGQTGIYIASLDAPTARRLLSADTNALYAPPGNLLFVRQGTLIAQRFDLQSLELVGDPVTVADQVAFDSTTLAAVSSSRDGALIYRTGQQTGSRQLVWFDRSGKQIGVVGAPDDGIQMMNPELSPDGNRVAVDRAVSVNRDVWLIETARGVSTRFTFEDGNDSLAVWSPDGSRVVYRSALDIYQKAASGVGTPELLLKSGTFKTPQDWSPDGRFLLYRNQDPTTGRDLWILPFSADRKPFPFLVTSFEERDGQFSPDGRWIAYTSTESGKFEIYVQPFPGSGGKWQISTDGGTQPRWRRDGKELFYASLDNKLMAAPITLPSSGEAVAVGTPAALFQMRMVADSAVVSNKQQYSVSADGQRFLINVATERADAAPITLILNWSPETKK